MNFMRVFRGGDFLIFEKDSGGCLIKKIGEFTPERSLKGIFGKF